MADDKTSSGKSTLATQVSGGGIPAGESSDPAVHKALADLQVAQANGDDDGEKAAKKTLSDLGVKAD